MQKFSLRLLLSIYLNFCQFQPGVAYKIVAYKKIPSMKRKENDKNTNFLIKNKKVYVNIK